MKIKWNRGWSLYNIITYVMLLLTIVLFIMMIIGGFFLSFFRETVYADFLDANDQHLSAIVNRHEDDMQMLEDIVTQMRLSDDMTKFKLEEQPEKAIKLKEHLRRYTTVSQFFDLLWYQYHEDIYIYNYSSSMRNDYFLEKGCILSKTSQEELEKILMDPITELRILSEQKRKGNFLNSYSDSSTITIFLRTIPPTYSETLIFMVPESYYDKLLYSENEDRRVTFLFYQGEFIVLRGEEENALNGLSGIWDQVHNDVIENTEITQKEVEIGETSYLISWQKGTSGIYYGTLQSMDILHSKILTEQLSIILLILICLILTCGMVLFFSQRIMKKVKSLNQLLKENSYYDLSSIENGIQALVMTQKESEKESLSLRKTRLIRNFVRGDFESRQDAVCEALKADMDINYDTFCMVIIRNKEINNENSVYSLMLDVISNNAKVNGYGIHLINNNRNLFVLFGDTSEDVECVLVNCTPCQGHFELV